MLSCPVLCVVLSDDEVSRFEFLGEPTLTGHARCNVDIQIDASENLERSVHSQCVVGSPSCIFLCIHGFKSSDRTADKSATRKEGVRGDESKYFWESQWALVFDS